ncbi:hypothetical protein [Streptomyces purpurascens]|uniref:Uncharacterized protein n=1 Tax=Streptomyces purpurascens TaxID=1924 RepID=A0ABZ1MAA5_STREF|nr:hypothetical protein [Streptomyces purpurascens]MCE7048228.1 hypothetical protein [Streptomyces purpurascens]GHA26624.1 hypothetical protein GCM10010303_41630 [Streptomyces purpurascens]
MSSLPARRLTTACIALVTVAALVFTWGLAAPHPSMVELTAAVIAVCSGVLFPLVILRLTGTVAAYLLVPRDRVGFRVQPTALDTDAGIDHLNGTPTRLSERFPPRLKG